MKTIKLRMVIFLTTLITVYAFHRPRKSIGLILVVSESISRGRDKCPDFADKHSVINAQKSGLKAQCVYSTKLFMFSTFTRENCAIFIAYCCSVVRLDDSVLGKACLLILGLVISSAKLLAVCTAATGS